MFTRLSAAVLAAGMLIGFGASAASYTNGNLCDMRSAELRQDLKLLTHWSSKYEPGMAQLQKANMLCAKGDKTGGLAVLMPAIRALDLPPHGHN